MTPKELTQMAYDLGVSGVDLNTLTFAIVDAMEASGEYFGPYDANERNFLEKYLIEEITPDRIGYCYSWLSSYVAPGLLPLTVSNATFYVLDGAGTPIGELVGLTPGSTVQIISGVEVEIQGRGSVVIRQPQANPGSFDVIFRESDEGIPFRDTKITFTAELSLNYYSYVTDDAGLYLTDDYGTLFLVDL